MRRELVALSCVAIAVVAACFGGSFTEQGTADPDGGAGDATAAAGDAGREGDGARVELDAGGRGDVATLHDAATTNDAATPFDASDACTLVQHTNGVGQTFTDCTPLGQYPETIAGEACVAFASASVCAGDGRPIVFTTYDGGACISWSYQGAPVVGRVHITSPGALCSDNTVNLYPTASDPTYE